MIIQDTVIPRNQEGEWYERKLHMDGFKINIEGDITVLSREKKNNKPIYLLIKEAINKKRMINKKSPWLLFSTKNLP